MPSRNQNFTFLALLLVSVVGLVAIISSVRTKRIETSRVEQTISIFREHLAHQSKRTNDALAQAFFVPAAQKVLDSLTSSSPPDLSFPTPYAALLTKKESTGEVFLLVYSIEQGHTPTRVILDTDNTVLAKTDRRFKPPRAVYASGVTGDETVDRTHRVKVFSPGEPTSGWSEASIRLDFSDLGRNLRVRLTADGHKSDPVEVFVDPSLTRATPGDA